MTRRVLWLALIGLCGIETGVSEGLSLPGLTMGPRKGGGQAQFAIEELNEKIWYDWNADDLADGAVASWEDAAGGLTTVQATGNRQPTKTADGVVFSTGTKYLTIPGISGTPHSRRAFVILFKADLANTANSAGGLFSFNGTGDVSPSRRTPGLRYVKEPATYITRWYGNAAGLGDVTLPAGDPEDWHVIISRRVDGVNRSSIDGQDEVLSDEDNLILVHVDTPNDGFLGDHSTTTIDATIKRLMILQGDMTDDEVDRVAGWAMWEMGMQANLPSEHPYKNAPPTTSPYVNPFVGNSAEDWVELEEYWEESGGDPPETESNTGELIAPLLEDFTEVFRDDFDSLTVTDDNDAPEDSDWFAPVQTDVGGDALPISPDASPTVYSHSGSELTITMQNSSGWKTGNLVSVNLDGRGNTWDPSEHPTYFEVRFRNSPGNDVASWAAFWLKAQEEFRMRTVPRTEIDIVEVYNGDNNGHHASYHNWPAQRQYAGRLHSHEWVSNYRSTGAAGTWPDKPVDMFDDEHHTYGMLIDDTWAIWTFDGREVVRTPVRPDMLRPLYMLISLAMYDDAGAADTYTMTLDWVRVLQDLN